jgi:adenylyltransferase/sulfurtransferase
MIPESKLDDYINKHEEIRKLSYRTLFHKSFYENIDATFPYQDLTLQQIGIPAFDVIQVSTNKGQFFVELSGDAELYM